ncbi:helix-turn-helix domain-containing protein [Loktanella sp. R86503]|uniref:helix-turn-helix domain-containing protein n=1 Tax=Loktanella sp. R86503 TaxID=3093847 RepID=UPI0036DC6353
MTKRANPMAVKASLTYEVSEAALALGKSKATIRNWIRDGLPVMAAQKPYLILGQALRDYIRARSQAAKSPLAQDELYCLSCKSAQRPHDLIVEVVPNNAQTIRLKGVCSDCGGAAGRYVSKKKLQQFAAIFTFKKSGSSDTY